MVLCGIQEEKLLVRKVGNNTLILISNYFILFMPLYIFYAVNSINFSMYKILLKRRIPE